MTIYNCLNFKALCKPVCFPLYYNIIINRVGHGKRGTESSDISLQHSGFHWCSFTHELQVMQTLYICAVYRWTLWPVTVVTPREQVKDNMGWTVSVLHSLYDPPSPRPGPLRTDGEQWIGHRRSADRLLTDRKRHQSVRKHRVGFYQIFCHLWVQEKAAKTNTWVYINIFMLLFLLSVKTCWTLFGSELHIMKR